jgi:histidinol-phosphate aminotransferase
MSATINRRQLLKSGFLTVGAMSVIPAYSWARTYKDSFSLDSSGRLIHSPFLREYTLPWNEHLKVPEIRLHSNENPYGPSPLAVEELRTSAVRGNRYAWAEQDELVEILARKEGVSVEHIMITPGSTEILQNTAIFFFKDGGNLITADPSFMTIMRVAQSVGATWKAVPLTSDWAHDLPAMEAAVDGNTKLIYVCNPNNPTGSMTPIGEVMDFCDRLSGKVPVFVDEAYYEFLEPDSIPSTVELVKKGRDVIVARTFSKIHGMAGLRVGYAIGQPQTLDKIRKYVVQGMGVSVTSLAAARASLEDVKFQELSRTNNKAARNFTLQALKDMGMKPVESFTSFILFPIEMNGKTFLEQMTSQGVGVRSLSINDQNYCRVSVGTLEEMKRFIKVAGKVLA